MIDINSLQQAHISSRRGEKIASGDIIITPPWWFQCLVLSLMMLFDRAGAGDITGTAPKLRGSGGGVDSGLRDGISRQLLPHWLCSFFDDTIDHRCEDEHHAHHHNSTHNTTAPPTCPVVEPLPNDESVFDLINFTSHSWFVQKQQINGFQPSVERDFFCLVHTFSPRFSTTITKEEEEGRDGSDDGVGGKFMDYTQYGTIGQVNGPQQQWDVGDNNLPPSMNTWCGGQDENGGGLLRIGPCFFRTLLAKVGFPMWVIAVANDYSWAIISGGEPKDMVQKHPHPLCTTRTEVDPDVLADSSGTGLWLLTKERIASNETIAMMEDILTEMGIYTGMLYPVVQEGCTYDNSGLIEEGNNNNNELEREELVEVDRDGDDDDDWLW